MYNDEAASPRFGGDNKNEDPEIIEQVEKLDLNHQGENIISPREIDHINKHHENFQVSLTEIHKDDKELKYYTMDEIKKHNNSQSLWMVLNEKVFDLTKYLPHHPGGEAKLLKGAGKDATSLFNKYHKWVNYNIMVGKLHIGYVKKDK